MRDGQPGRHVPDDGHPVLVQPGDGADHSGGRHRDERGRPLGQQLVHRQQQGQRARSDAEGGPVSVLDDPDERLQLGQDAIAVHAGTGHVAELAHDHQHGAACQVTDQQRLGEQFGDPAEAGHPGERAPACHDEAERGGERHHPVLVPVRHRGDGGACHQRDGRLRADRQHPGAAHRRIDHEGGQRRPEADHRRHIDDRGVRHDLRDQVGGHGDPGEQVRPQPGTPIAAQPGQARGRRAERAQQQVLALRIQPVLGRAPIGQVGERGCPSTQRSMPGRHLSSQPLLVAALRARRLRSATPCSGAIHARFTWGLRL